MTELAALCTAFHKLHDDRRCFVMPNAWDAGSAIVLAEAGFSAIATTSAGIAFSMGRADHVLPAGARQVSRDRMMERCREIAEAVDVPVNGDLENGYGHRPEDVAITVRAAIDAGLAGCNIEDYAGGGLYDEELAVERIAAGREAADASGLDFVLTARTDGALLPEPTSMDDAIRRCNRYREAGADCLFIPGRNDLESIALLCREVDAPINFVMGLGDTSLTVDRLAEAGIVRISTGGSITRATLGLVRQGARELRERGTITFASIQISQRELNLLFAAREADESS
jgi:2-methylisocitrate lyase-like PEP mutase family enzyme